MSPAQATSFANDFGRKAMSFAGGLSDANRQGGGIVACCVSKLGVWFPEGYWAGKDLSARRGEPGHVRARVGSRTG